MKILSVNAGSSSLKFTLFELPENEELINGVFERIGLDNSFYTIKRNGSKTKKEVDLKNHSEAVKILIDELVENKVIASLNEIDGIGHRVVHGADKYSSSVLITEEVINDLERFSDLAPLHNPANVVGIKAFKDYSDSIPNIAVFDTAFHQTMKETEYLYAVPYEWYEKYGVRKYGFHGTSHRYIYQTISEELNNKDLKVISCHLGNGASISAIKNGEVIDTTMGFTPLAGVVMGTRCGDIDASIIPYVMEKSDMSLDEVMNALNKKSGLLGISGLSNDSRDVEIAAEKNNERAILTQDISSQKVANYIAMYNNLLDGADVICFTAGIGENSKLTRQMVVDRIKSLGVSLNDEANDVRGKFKKVSDESSKIDVYVVPTNEELMIALDTFEIINK